MLPKDYVSVATRVDQFHTDHEQGISIDTAFTLQWEVACFKATVTTKKGTFTWSSFGKLWREKAFEKLETVAVGRALAFAGYETRDGIASKEEMEVFDTNNPPTSDEAPKEAPILFGNIINEIKAENDSNSLDIMLSVVKEGNWSEKQKAWAIREVATRKQFLNNIPQF